MKSSSLPSCLPSNILTGKRKRLDTEFDSDTESVCSNSRVCSNSQLPSMAIDREQLLRELVKGRLRQHPYTAVINWSDSLFWMKLMRVMFPNIVTAPSTREVMRVIRRLQDAYFSRVTLDMNPEELSNLNIVFGPKHDNGPLNISLVNPLYLPECDKVVKGENAMMLGLDSMIDDGSSTDDDITYAVDPVVIRDITTKPHEGVPPRKKKTKIVCDSSSLETYSPNLSSHSNSLSLDEGKCFSIPQVGTVDKNGLCALYAESIEEFSVEDQALLMYHCGPASSAYGSVLMSDPKNRKSLLQGYLLNIKENGPPHKCLQRRNVRL